MTVFNNTNNLEPVSSTGNGRLGFMIVPAPEPYIVSMVFVCILIGVGYFIRALVASTGDYDLRNSPDQVLRHRWKSASVPVCLCLPSPKAVPDDSTITCFALYGWQREGVSVAIYLRLWGLAALAKCLLLLWHRAGIQ